MKYGAFVSILLIVLYSPAEAQSSVKSIIPLEPYEAQFDARGRKIDSLFRQAGRLFQSGNTRGSLVLLRRVIEADPNFYEAQYKYVALTSEVVKRSPLDTVAKQYAIWMKRFPVSAALPYVMGWAYNDEKDPRAVPYLLKAVAIDSTLASAYRMLASQAERVGNTEDVKKFLGNASIAQPSNPDYAFDHAVKYRDADSARYRIMMLDVAKRFPGSDRGAQALAAVAYNVLSDSARIDVLEDLRKRFSPAKFPSSAAGMQKLFDIYIQMSPDRAVVLSEQMIVLLPESRAKVWKSNLVFASSIARVAEFVDALQFVDAVTLLGKTQLPFNSESASFFILLKAKVAAMSGNTQLAYDSLLARFSRIPDDNAYNAIVEYASVLGKTTNQVDLDIWELREALAEPATPFALPVYGSSRKKSLADYKGELILLTFWFPGCAPCLSEFPHFEKVIKQFEGQLVNYVSINVEPDLDKYVVPFIQRTKYSFTPLRGTWEFARSTYGVEGMPANFLIDQRGRVIFSNFRVNSSAGERTLYLMIRSALDRYKGEQAKSDIPKSGTP